MQMNGIHVTPVIKGSCLFAKHWNAIWQFCWRQQAQKNNHHLPQKSKSLGQEGEECRVSWCVCALQAGVTENPRQRGQPGAQILHQQCRQTHPPPLPLFYTAEQPCVPWHPGFRDIWCRASKNEHYILSVILPCHWQVAESLCVRNESLSASYRERHKTSSTTLQGKEDMPLSWLLALHFLHTDLEHSERNSVLV